MGYEYRIVGNISFYGEVYSRLEYALTDMRWYESKYPAVHFHIERKLVGDWEEVDLEERERT